jgi:hypothetical protein
MKLPESIQNKIKERTRLFDDMTSSHGIEAVEVYDVEELIVELYADLMEARDALLQINKEELNSQRPGGDYSRSSKISYNALVKLNEKYGSKG